MIMGRFRKAGFTLMDAPDQADTILVNTCGFIEDAVNQSIDTILALAQFKRKGLCRRLIVIGCLPERYREEMVASLPEVDYFVGTGAIDEVVAIAQDSNKTHGCWLPPPQSTPVATDPSQRLYQAAPFAYLKIAEGCDRRCTYCIIPQLRGPQKSRSIENIALEARLLLESGVGEINLIAQDTTHYGVDLNPPASLGGLLDHLAPMAAPRWLRFLYGHPDSMEQTLIQTVARHPNVCSYFDIPIQHASASVLKRMGRQYDAAFLYDLFETIRSHIPDAALRTTLIVGFPGESDDEFEELLNFIETVRFDHLGVFTYSDADDLTSHHLDGHLPQQLARKRCNRLMAAQRAISAQNMARHIDKVYAVLIETEPEDNLYIGRTAFQAPEVDGVTYIHAHGLDIGACVDVRITDALEYDLVGETL